MQLTVSCSPTCLLKKNLNFLELEYTAIINHLNTGGNMYV
jgi:hypothetical protein